MKFLIISVGGRAKGKQYGMGHVFRTLTLSQELKKYGKINYLLEDHGHAKKIIEKNNFKIFSLKKNIKFEERITKTLELIHKLKIDCVIIDWNRIEKKFVSEMKKYVKTIIITDEKNKDFQADLVINGFIGFKNSKIKNKFGTTCLIGPKYQILNKQFSKFKKRKKENDLLVSLGGFDEKNISEYILKCIDEINPRLKTRIILGPATVKTKKIKNLEKKLKNTTVIQQTDKMYHEMMIANAGISGGGLTSYEFAVCDIPFVIICQHKHQLLAAKKWERMSIAKNLGMYNATNKKKIFEFIKKLPMDGKNKKKSIIDGKGVTRIALEINKLVATSNENKYPDF